MRRLLRRLIVFASVLGLVTALNVGVAFANHGDNPNSPFAAAEKIADGVGEPPPEPPPPLHVQAALATPGAIPVGSALGFPDPGDHQALLHMSDTVGDFAIAHNPNCPAHYAP